MAEILMVSEHLHRTLSFFDGGGEFGKTEASASVKAPAAPKRGKDAFIVFSETDHRTPLLFTKAIALLALRLDVDEKRLLDVSSIPMRTFHRRQEKSETLSATETDRVLRIARVASQAADIFGDELKARRWLSKPNRVLGGTPLEMLATDAGAHEVEAELHRVDLGDFA